ncbi:MAG: type II toxin-antitoxin system Phd/YefM family antitoxin [Coraliomargarita sp.]
MTTIQLSEAKAHLGRYARAAAKGEHFIISERNKPVAVIGPTTQSRVSGVRPKLGLMKNKLSIPEGFDQPLPDFEADFDGA